MRVPIIQAIHSVLCVGPAEAIGPADLTGDLHHPEIDRLRQENSDLCKLLSKVCADQGVLLAENEALRHLLSIDKPLPDAPSINPKWDGWH